MIEIFEKIPSGSGINTEIVVTLKEYKKGIPVDFLATKLHRTTKEIQGPLENLEHQGVIKIQNNVVSIVP